MSIIPTSLPGFALSIRDVMPALCRCYAAVTSLCRCYAAFPEYYEVGVSITPHFVYTLCVCPNKPLPRFEVFNGYFDTTDVPRVPPGKPGSVTGHEGANNLSSL